jgi:hypothetical protein
MYLSRKSLGILLHMYLLVRWSKRESLPIKSGPTRRKASKFHVVEYTANCFIENLTLCSSLWALK